MFKLKIIMLKVFGIKLVGFWNIKNIILSIGLCIYWILFYIFLLLGRNDVLYSFYVE